VIGCEICKAKYLLICREESPSCWNTTRYVAAVSLDLVFFFGILMGLYLLCGYVGDLSFTKTIVNALHCPGDTNATCGNVKLPFLTEPIWAGRIWFWGFILFFFILGCCACCVACCFRGIDESGSYAQSNYSRGDCWWIWCGPSYYNGNYYYYPYGYWYPGDCCYWCYYDSFYFHHHAGCACDGLCSEGCHGLNSCDGCDAGDSDSAAVLLVIFLIIVAIIVAIGIVVGAVLGFLIVSKIIKRHLVLLQRQADAKRLIVADLDDPHQVAQAASLELEDLVVAEKKEESDKEVIKMKKEKVHFSDSEST